MQTECIDRIYSPKMEYYRDVYSNSERWNGVESLKGKRIIVYCEQGYGDIIQFARCIPYLKQQGCEVVLHCPQALHSLFTDCLPGVDSVFDKDEEKLPPHDFHVLSLSMPFLLKIERAAVPYIHLKEKADLGVEMEPFFKIGIAWEGNKEHTNNEQRSCLLNYFREIHDLPNVKLFMIQKEINDPRFLVGAEDLEIYGSEINDFKDTAKLINAMDTIACVDTSVLHLAGAMNKSAHGLLSIPEDARWKACQWYSSVKFARQQEEGVWEDAFEMLMTYIMYAQQLSGKL